MRLLTLIYLLLAVVTKTIAQQPLWQNVSRVYKNDEFFNAAYLTSCVQDSKGVLYFGTITGGIISYDGTKFEKVISNLQIYNLEKDLEGNIYYQAGNEFGKLDLDVAGNIVIKKLSNRNKDDSIKFSASAKSPFIIANNEWVYTSYQREILVHNIKTETSQIHRFNSKVFLFQYKESAYAYSDEQRTLFRFKGNRLIKLDWALKQDSVKDLTFMSSTSEFPIVKTKNKYYFYIPDSTNESFEQQPILKELVKLNQEGETIKIKNGKLANYFISRKNGIIALNTDGVIQNYFNKSIGKFPSDFGALAYEDNSGYLWLGYDNYLVKVFSGNELKFMETENVMKGTPIYIRKFENYLYVSTAQGLYRIDSFGKVEEISFKEPSYGVPGVIGLELITIQGKQRLLASNGAGIYEIDGLKASKIYIGQEMKDANSVVNDFKQDPGNPNSIYYSHQNELIKVSFDGLSWNRHKIGYVKSNLFVLQNNHVWYLNENNKIVNVQPSEIGSKRKEISIDKSLKVTLMSMYNDTLLLAIEKKGFYFLNAATNQFEPYCGPLDKQYCNDKLTAYSYKEDKNGNKIITVIGGNDFFLKKHADGKITTSFPFAKVRSVYIGVPWFDEDGTLWFCDGTNGRVYRYFAKLDTMNYQATFSCIIRKVLLNGDSTLYASGYKPSTPRSRAVLKNSAERFSFQFAAPYFVREDETLYSYRLVGAQDEWSKWEAGKYEVDFNFLSEGDYAFEVRARNVYGIISSIDTFSFRVLPPWYRSVWAYLSYVIAGILLIVLIIRWRTKVLQNEKVLLENRVTERTNELMQTQTKLIESEKMASLGQLTAGIAHEINNPLNFISGGIQGIKALHDEIFDSKNSITKQKSDELKYELSDLMRSVETGIQRVSGIVNSLRQFSNPLQEVNSNEKVDVKESIVGALIILRGKLSQANVKVETNIEHQQLVRANNSQIIQVLVNLIDNAVHAVEKNTAVKKIVIQSKDIGDSVVISIYDNGAGISEENKNKIFNPFFTTKSVGKGTGLGLSICYGIITKHKGTLTFNSTVGEGTEFILSIPV